MSTLRVTSLAATSAPTAGATPVLRVTALSNAPAGVTVTLTGPATARAGERVQLVATASDGSTSGLTFAQTAGPTVTLTVSGNVVAFDAPRVASSTPVNVTIRVTLTKPGTSDAVASKTVAVSPVAAFYLSAVGSWEPRVSYLLLPPAGSVSTYSTTYNTTY